ncbi:hypothetical protein P153DRAFT_367445 [Dothidotthia symphoricarpi CBS 119687]|uniref:Uncharacterized protein n=1 Tax=Dothidotthia symphoricarpi CBS 119687 TaxID=1392245 RepID=A0A6A6A8T6_9PLEO|nr:uncharacterized protein P153DRAFT_367445 [Dothidotthia symphoricarpi CBS 119687]KAF2128269.1 hypothetical protein P153DRAFT_367445 [Dothidotthia symphoricarpi CBS 119687]
MVLVAPTANLAGLKSLLWCFHLRPAQVQSHMEVHLRSSTVRHICMPLERNAKLWDDGSVSATYVQYGNTHTWALVVRPRKRRMESM